MRVAALTPFLMGIVLGTAFADSVPDVQAMVQGSGDVLLDTRVYLPTTGQPPRPVFIGRTPYAYAVEEGEWTPYGICFVQQATRGQWGSEGEFDPFTHDGEDGRALVEWVLAQPWCDGRAGLFAGSAKGTLSALTLPGAHGLTCFILRPTAADLGDQFVYQGGVYRKGVLDIWLNKWDIAAPYLEERWRAIAPNSMYWEQFNIETRADQVTMPGLHVGGYYDVVVRGTVNFFMACQYRGGPGARGAQRLVMRATAHARYDFLEGLTFDLHPNYLDFNTFAYERAFAYHQFYGIDGGIGQDMPVIYYTVGDDTAHDGPGWEWRQALRWPPLPPRETAYYLHPGGLLDPAEPEMAAGRWDFKYNPLDPVPTVGGQNIKSAADRAVYMRLAYGPYDQNLIGPRTDVLHFYTPALVAPVETTGRFHIRLHVSSDAVDTDFTVKVVDAYPEGDGREILVLDTIQRVKYRHGRGMPEAPLEPGEVAVLDLVAGDTSWVFNTGHRIGLHISSSNYPRFDVNPNNGDDIPGLNPPVIATNSVHMGRIYPSAIYMPVRMPDADTDGDGETDEAAWNRPDGDMDGDGVPDEEEFYRRPGLDPFNPDTDGDGYTDGEELAQRTDPTNPESYPDAPGWTRHDADQNGDWRFGLDELLRVIQFFNAGAYHCDAGGGGEDGYLPGHGEEHGCGAHSADSDGDWRLALGELLRVVQFFNSGGYRPCPNDGTEDGFCLP